MQRTLTSLAGTLGALAIGLACAPRADAEDFSDIRLVGTALNKNYDAHVSGDTTVGGVHFSDDSNNNKWDKAWRAGVVAQHLSLAGDSPLGFSSGLGVFYNRYEDQDDNSDKSKFEALSAQLRLGLGISVADVLHFEILPLAGIGAARGKIGDVDSGDVDLYWEYGIEAGAYLTIAHSIQFGVNAGWMKSGMDLKFDDQSQFNGAPVENVEVKIRNKGTYVGASIGSRF